MTSLAIGVAIWAVAVVILLLFMAGSDWDDDQ